MKKLLCIISCILLVLLCLSACDSIPTVSSGNPYAENVIREIEKIPSAEELSLKDETKVKKARSAYNNLDANTKALVTNIATLSFAEARISELKLLEIESAKIKALQASAKAVSDRISALPEKNMVTLRHEKAISEIRQAYNALSKEAKEYIEDLARLSSAEAKITSLKKTQNGQDNSDTPEQPDLPPLANEPTAPFTVLFYTNGGAIDGAEQKDGCIQTEYAEAVSLPTPKRDYFTFKGWYKESELSGEAVTAVSSSSTLYARWQENIASVLENVSDYATEETKDVLPTRADGIIFSYSSSSPLLYSISDGKVSLSKAHQAHSEQKVTVSVTAHFSNGGSLTRSKTVTVAPVNFADIPPSPLATYFQASDIFAYQANNERYLQTGKLFSEEAKQALDILFIQFAATDEKGNLLVMESSYSAALLSEISELRKEDTRIVMSISCSSAEDADTFAEVISDPALRKNLIKSIMDTVVYYNFDGVDIVQKLPSALAKREDMTAFASELRQEMNARANNDTPYLLSISVCANEQVINSFDFAKLNKNADYINLISYDMASPDRTSHLSPLYASAADGAYSCDLAVNRLAELDVDKNKIIIGSTGHAKAYKLIGGSEATGSAHLGMEAELTKIEGCDASFEDGTLLATAIPTLLASRKYEKFTETDENGRLVGCYLYNAADGIFITYETPQTLSEKYSYANENGMGIMCDNYALDVCDSIINTVSQTVS